MMYSRTDSSAYVAIDRWEDGVGWLAHPDEPGKRASHVVRGEEGLWILDPLDTPGVEALIDDLGGDVAGIAVCSSYHARDADRFANRYDVPVSVPAWMGRIEKRTDAPIRYYQGDLEAGISVIRMGSIPGVSEAVLSIETHNTLYVPDMMGTIDPFTVEGERLGLSLFWRVTPPQSLRYLEPDRVLVGHGEGIFEEATQALEYALTGRRRVRRALRENGPAMVRSVVDAVR